MKRGLLLVFYGFCFFFFQFCSLVIFPAASRTVLGTHTLINIAEVNEGTAKRRSTWNTSSISHVAGCLSLLQTWRSYPVRERSALTVLSKWQWVWNTFCNSSDLWPLFFFFFFFGVLMLYNDTLVSAVQWLDDWLYFLPISSATKKKKKKKAC